METGQPQASIAKNIFEGIVSFLPDWLQIPLLCLLVLLIVLGWISSIRKKIAQRRAARTGQPVAAPQYNQGSGADHLGPYAPAPQTQQPSGADYLGPYAAAQQAPQAAPPQPSGADYLGSYAPQQRRDGD
ncbi:hypothetical protein J7E88_20455 [Streptomyces sp. ISL-10]|uniref:hypothetical protein n=1 Tax=Streptomyces sp. ISL-10 TaxID=2819172 RepID=UPI001BE9411E|nr:hypothetical protein [Streptomyces sp. ISL-10]MBT2367610.1 hypothetical protein [Streptomyces sp. ISL-10]